MATGNMLLGLSRKKLGDIVFYRSDGQQRARVRVRNIRNPRSEKQSVQRMVLATASKTLAALRNLYDHSFEQIAVGAASTRYAQKLLMEGYRTKAAEYFDSSSVADPRYTFAIKGAPIAACYDGMPLTRGRLSLPAVSFGQLAISAELAATITTQEQYAADLAKFGFEPGDQMTVVIYFQTEDIVAQYGSAANVADGYRYARITFVSELPSNFSGPLIVAGGQFNPSLIEKAEGVFPAVSADTEYLNFDFEDVLPAGVADPTAFAIVRSQLQSNGRTYYSNSNFIGNSGWVGGNLTLKMESYMDGAEGIEVGSNLYLKNAVAAPFA